MRKINFLLFVILAAFGFTIQAQSVDFGVKAGLNLASITGDDTSGLDSRTAFHFGVVAEISVSDKFSVQPELLYSAQGAKESFLGESIKVNFDYLTLPIMAKFYVSKGFSLEAGPQLGFLMSSKIKAVGESEDLKDITKGIDFGLDFGVGYKMDSGLNFGARYNLGLSNFWDIPSGTVDPEFGIGDIKNQNAVIQLYVGYFF
jgi:hypothetical protein